MITIADAILSLRPNAEWVMYNDDIENIIWHTKNVAPLDIKEINDEIARLEINAENEKIEKEKMRNQLLERLNISEEDLVLLLNTKK